MEDDFSQSLTPPVSPFMDEELGDSSLAQPPCFSCAFEKGREEAQTLSSDGYVSRGVLKRYEATDVNCTVAQGIMGNSLTHRTTPLIKADRYDKE